MISEQVVHQVRAQRSQISNAGVPHKEELLVVKARRERDLQSSKDLTTKKTDEKNKLRFFVKRSPEKVLSIIES